MFSSSKSVVIFFSMLFLTSNGCLIILGSVNFKQIDVLETVSIFSDKKPAQCEEETHSAIIFKLFFDLLISSFNPPISVLQFKASM